MHHPTIVLACGLLAGCGDTYTIRPVEITVTNNALNEPVRDVELRVGYFAWIWVTNVPEDVAGRTGQDGKIVLSVADFHKGAIGLAIGDPAVHFSISPEVARHGGEATENDVEPTHEYKVSLKPVSR